MGNTFQIANNFFSRQLACNWSEVRLLLKVWVNVLVGLSGRDLLSNSTPRGRFCPSTSSTNGVPIDTRPLAGDEGELRKLSFSGKNGGGGDAAT